MCMCWRRFQPCPFESLVVAPEFSGFLAREEREAIQRPGLKPAGKAWKPWPLQVPSLPLMLGHKSTVAELRVVLGGSQQAAGVWPGRRCTFGRSPVTALPLESAVLTSRCHGVVDWESSTGTAWLTDCSLHGCLVLELEAPSAAQLTPKELDALPWDTAQHLSGNSVRWVHRRRPPPPQAVGAILRHRAATPLAAGWSLGASSWWGSTPQTGWAPCARTALCRRCGRPAQACWASRS